MPRLTPPLRITRRGKGVALGVVVIAAAALGMLTANWTYYDYTPVKADEGTYQYFGDDIATLHAYWEEDTRSDRP